MAQDNQAMSIEGLWSNFGYPWGQAILLRNSRGPVSTDERIYRLLLVRTTITEYVEFRRSYCVGRIQELQCFSIWALQSRVRRELHSIQTPVGDANVDVRTFNFTDCGDWTPTDDSDGAYFVEMH